MSMLGSGSSGMGLSKPKKCEFTIENGRFEGKYNENISSVNQSLSVCVTC